MFKKSGRCFNLIFLSIASAATGISTAAAEPTLWRCELPGAANPIVTNTPAAGPGAICTAVDLSSASFLKVPAEQFRLLGAADDSEETALAAPPAQRQPPRAALKLDSERGLRPSTSFAAKEAASPRRGKRGGFDTRCEISGTARSGLSGEGKIRIRRGALTVDELPVKLGGNGRPVKWRTSLTGACRNPEVTVEGEK